MNTERSLIDLVLKRNIIVRLGLCYSALDRLRYLRREGHALKQKRKLRHCLVRIFQNSGLCAAITPFTIMCRQCRKMGSFTRYLMMSIAMRESRKRRASSTMERALRRSQQENRRSIHLMQRELDEILTKQYKDVLCIKKRGLWHNVSYMFWCGDI